MAPRLSRMNLRKLRRDFVLDYFLGDNFESYFVNEIMETVLKERISMNIKNGKGGTYLRIKMLELAQQN
jgi:hypothetical protein